ncbi:hypothetical protein [Priestia megaterium]|uniref:hypothetical protein n=1 Tax=Priestia megaterium TaxID=1404 RepID=UPI00362C5C7D
MSTDQIIKVAEIVGTVVVAFLGGKFIFRINKTKKKDNTEVSQTDGTNQISIMNSNNNTVNIGDVNGASKQDKQN